MKINKKPVAKKLSVKAPAVKDSERAERGRSSNLVNADSLYPFARTNVTLQDTLKHVLFMLSCATSFKYGEWYVTSHPAGMDTKWVATRGRNDAYSMLFLCSDGSETGIGSVFDSPSSVWEAIGRVR